MGGSFALFRLQSPVPEQDGVLDRDAADNFCSDGADTICPLYNADSDQGRVMMKKFQVSGFRFQVCHFATLSLTSFLIILASCNNPFETRTPQQPATGGVTVKPANTPENVLYNMRVTFEALSVQDYLDVFSDDFVFNPDPEDSIEYEDRFGSVWNKNREIDFANNFFLAVNADTLAHNSVSVTLFKYSYRPGQDMYEYDYEVEIVIKEKLTVLSGRAWLFLREYSDGKWYIYQWVDHRYEKKKITWGVLRALYI